MSQDRALIVFAKVPIPGAVKTRLTSLISAEEAAELYAAFLEDALEQYAALNVDVRLYLAPSDDKMPAQIMPPSITTHVQKGSGLGARMQQAFLETFMSGYQRVAIIGTDHPTLPSALISFAFETLEHQKQIVVGPSDDGGFYLLGMNEFYGALFRNMTYSHEEVFSQTIERVKDTPAELTVLPVWYDIDTPADLQRLQSDLKETNSNLIKTSIVLDQLKARYPVLLNNVDEQANRSRGVA